LPLKLGEREDGRRIGGTKGGLNSKLHAVTDAIGRPVRMIPTAGRISCCTGTPRLVGDLPEVARRLVAGRGHDVDRFRRSLTERRIDPCIPPRLSRVEPISRNPELYRRRHLVENLFGRPGTGGRAGCAVTDVPRSSCRRAFMQRPTCSAHEV